VIHRRLTRALIVAGIALVVAAPLADAHVNAEGEHGGSGDEDEATADGEQAADSGGVTVENAATQDDVDSANLLGIIGIVVGALGLLVGGIALFRRRSA
jgi:hypothetical protein